VGRNTLRLLDLPGPALEHYLAPYEAYPRRLTTASVYAFWVLAALAVAGAFTAAARRAPGAFWALVPFIALPSVLFLGATRYRAPADPFLLVLAALALVAARDRVAAGRGARRRPRPASLGSTR
jgi:hypothetical protein